MPVMYVVSFGIEQKLSTDDKKAFKSFVAASTGIACLQRTTPEQTDTFKLDDEALPLEIRGDWQKIAEYITKLK